MTRPTKRSIWQLATVVLLAAATAGVVAINDMTQSPRTIAPAAAGSPSPQLVGEEGNGARGHSSLVSGAPSWLTRAAVEALSTHRDTTPSAAYWGYASGGQDVWGVTGAAHADGMYYWLVFTGDFQLRGASTANVRHGRSLVLAIDASSHEVTGSSLSAAANVKPSSIDWLRSLHLPATEQ